MNKENIIISWQKPGTVSVYAIVKAIGWYDEITFKRTINILPDDLVVCKWSDFHDGEKSNIEGKTTIAICRQKDDAELIWRKYITQEALLIPNESNIKAKKIKKTH